MACRDPKNFDAYIRERLAAPSRAARSEAARVVLDFADKDRVPMGEAVLLAIEALPASKTKQLRRIVDLFEPWCEWLDKWSEHGWSLDYPRAGFVDVEMPPKVSVSFRDRHTFPSDDVVAAAIGAEKVELVGAAHGGAVRFRIVR